MQDDSVSTFSTLGNPSSKHTVPRRLSKTWNHKCRARSRRGESWTTTASRSIWTTFSLRTRSRMLACSNSSRLRTSGSKRKLLLKPVGRMHAVHMYCTIIFTYNLLLERAHYFILHRALYHYQSTKRPRASFLYYVFNELMKVWQEKRNAIIFFLFLLLPLWWLFCSNIFFFKPF